MDKLPPIPTPASQRWREFRKQVLPTIIFVGVALSVAFLWKSLVAPTGMVGGAAKAHITRIQGSTVAQSNRIEIDLPVLVSIPDALKLAPGESVDLIKPAKP